MDDSSQPLVHLYLTIRTERGLVLEDNEYSSEGIWSLPKAPLSFSFHHEINTFLYERYSITADTVQPYFMAEFNRVVCFGIWCRDFKGEIILPDDARCFTRKETHELRSEGLLTIATMELLRRHAY